MPCWKTPADTPVSQPKTGWRGPDTLLALNNDLVGQCWFSRLLKLLIPSSLYVYKGSYKLLQLSWLLSQEICMQMWARCSPPKASGLRRVAATFHLHLSLSSAPAGCSAAHQPVSPAKALLPSQRSWSQICRFFGKKGIVTNQQWHIYTPRKGWKLTFLKGFPEFFCLIKISDKGREKNPPQHKQHAVLLPHNTFLTLVIMKVGHFLKQFVPDC